MPPRSLGGVLAHGRGSSDGREQALPARVNARRPGAGVSVNAPAWPSQETVKKERACTGTCRVLYTRFKHYWKNYSHHTGACYGTSPQRQGAIVDQGGRYSIGDTGDARARPGRLIRRHDGRSGDGVPLNYTKPGELWLGATSVASADSRRVGALVNGLVAQLNQVGRSPAYPPSTYTSSTYLAHSPPPLTSPTYLHHLPFVHLPFVHLPIVQTCPTPARPYRRHTRASLHP